MGFTMTKKVEIFTDGSCLGNPGPGGWGALLRYDGVEKKCSGACDETTNNRMELFAAIAALEKLKRRSDVVITTDSRYVQRGVNEWLQGWKQNNWRNSARKPVKNKDLWEKLDKQLENHNVFSVKPGITGWAQIAYPYGVDAYDAEQKLMYDIYYIKNWSIWLEVEICFKTLLVILDKKGF